MIPSMFLDVVDDKIDVPHSLSVVDDDIDVFRRRGSILTCLDVVYDESLWTVRSAWWRRIL